jgi:hypothetical protein
MEPLMMEKQLRLLGTVFLLVAPLTIGDPVHAQRDDDDILSPADDDALFPVSGPEKVKKLGLKLGFFPFVGLGEPNRKLGEEISQGIRNELRALGVETYKLRFPKSKKNKRSGNVEMSSHRKQKSKGWFMFQCALLGSKKGRYKRGVYVCAETANSLEMMNLSCCPPKELPKAIWIRVSALPEKTLAWILSSPLKESDSVQMGLGDFSDLGDLPTPPLGKPLALPGPPSSPYEFL